LPVAAPQSASRKGLLALAAVVALLPLALANNYTYEIAILVGLNAIVCVGLNFLVGYAGQISLGHAGFYALGAYTSAILAAGSHWPGVRVGYRSANSGLRRASRMAAIPLRSCCYPRPPTWWVTSAGALAAKPVSGPRVLRSRNSECP